MAIIHQEISISAPVAKVYGALASADQIGTWWDQQKEVRTSRGLVLEHDPGPEHGVVRLRVVGLVPDKRVEWECISTHPKSSPASAWTGTRFIFELAVRTESAGVGRDQVRTTTVGFRQVGFDDRSEFLQANITTWGQALHKLKQVVESPPR